MTDEQREEILRSAYETLGRTAHVQVKHRDHDDDDALTRWRKNMPKAARSPSPRSSSLTDSEVQSLVDTRIAAALDAHAALWRDIIGAVIAEERKRHRAEIAKLKSEFDLRVSALLAEVDKLQRDLGDARGAEVIDLPAMPLRVAS